MALDLFLPETERKRTETLSGQSIPRLFTAMESALTDCRDLIVGKEHSAENNDVDALMSAFHVTPAEKRAHAQFYGQAFGRCWESLVCMMLSETNPGYRPPLRVGAETPCDCLLGDLALDMKYRFGSGDGRTIGKIRSNGDYLREQGLRPHLLILRSDSMGNALSIMRRGGWTILEGEATLAFLRQATGLDVVEWLNGIRDSGRFATKAPVQSAA